jgi:hypothetical protein
MADSETHQELPKSVDEAIDRLLNDLSEDDKEYLRGVSDPSELHFSLGLQIRNVYGLWGDNTELLASCAKASGHEPLIVDSKEVYFGFHPDEASAVIIKALLERLKKTGWARC